MSQHPHRVLLAVDGSANSDQAARYLAQYCGIFGVREILVLFVLSEPSIAIRMPGSKEMSAQISAIGQQATAEATRILHAAQLPCALDTEVGDPADVIIRDAEAEHADEIVMGFRGTGRSTSIALGSVAYKVLHRAGIPVTIVPAPTKNEASPPLANDIHRVLLAVDGSKPAARAVEYVCGLRGAHDRLKVELLHVPADLLAPQGYIRSTLEQQMVDKWHQEAGKAALQAGRDALRAAGISFDACIVPGRPADNIVQAAEQHRCTRIVMGTRGLGPLAGLILGSVAYTVLHLTRIPITLVK